MAAKKKQSKNPHIGKPRKFQDGDSVLIIRPNMLWFGCSGVVVSFADGLHRVRIEAKEGGSTCSHFHADIPSEELEEYL